MASGIVPARTTDLAEKLRRYYDANEELGMEIGLRVEPLAFNPLREG